MRKSFILLISFFILSTVLVLPRLVLGESIVDYNEQPCLKDGTCGLNDIEIFFSSAANKVFGVVGGIALLMFVIGGVFWVISGGESKKVETGKRIMMGAVIGIIVLFSAWILIKALEDILGVENEYRPAGMEATEPAPVQPQSTK